MGIRRSFSIYWDAYGGTYALLRSPYLWISFIAALAVMVARCNDNDWKWYDIVISTVPNILGFSLGGYAILVGFGDKDFLQALRGREKNEGNCVSPYMKISAAFVHFIMVQSGSLILAVITSALKINPLILSFLGFWLYVYSLFTLIAATLAVLNFSDWYDRADDE